MVAWERRKAVDKTMAVGSLSRSSAADAKADGASKKVRAVMLEVRLNSISILNTICFAANLTSPPPHALTSTSSHSLSHLNDLSTRPPLPSLRLLPSPPRPSMQTSLGLSTRWKLGTFWNDITSDPKGIGFAFGGVEPGKA